MKDSIYNTPYEDDNDMNDLGFDSPNYKNNKQLEKLSTAILKENLKPLNKSFNNFSPNRNMNFKKISANNNFQNDNNNYILKPSHHNCKLFLI